MKEREREKERKKEERKDKRRKEGTRELGEKGVESTSERDKSTRKGAEGMFELA